MRRSLPILIVALVAAPALSGCLVAQATAMEQRSTAESRAQGWHDDAQLVRVVGVEGTFPSGWGGYSGGSGWGGQGWSGSGGQARVQQGSNASYWDRAKDDENIGDGRAEIWVYIFVSDSDDQAYRVVVDRDGEIVASEEFTPEETMTPIGEWNIDSDRALEIAKENNQGLREGTDSENFGIVSVLEREPDEDHARWTIAGGGGDESGGGGGVVVIDAVTGEIVESHSSTS